MLDIYGLIKSLWGMLLSGLLPAGVPHGLPSGQTAKVLRQEAGAFPAGGCEV